MSEKPKALAEQCESVLESVLGLALHLIKSLKFNRQNPQQLFAVCLFARLVELASGCKALLEKKPLLAYLFCYVVCLRRILT